jgi:hypothetical protein
MRMYSSQRNMYGWAPRWWTKRARVGRVTRTIGDLFMAVRDIAAIGATGHQGGLARAIMADDTGAFAARAVTRRPDSEPARKLAKLGAEVVQADLGDEPSLHAAFAGAYGAYVVTDFFGAVPGGSSSPAEEGQI